MITVLSEAKMEVVDSYMPQTFLWVDGWTYKASDFDIGEHSLPLFSYQQSTLASSKHGHNVSLNP